LQLAACYRYFPPDTVFLAVVDPGVGSSRRAIAAEAGGYRFVAPDNGILSLVFREAAPSKVVELREARYALPEISATFEGRDRFAPAAAWLSTGVELGRLGPAVYDHHQLELPEPTVAAGEIHGMVVTVDHFGNLVTNIPRALVPEPGSVRIRVGGQAVPAFAPTYAQLPTDTAGALFGSTGHLEIAVNRGSAAARLGLGRGTAVDVSRVLK
ncbi:MAG TPA: SAM-dependent chlorinase/fluorinase, partial [Vicinamibacterales bacterium]